MPGRRRVLAGLKNVKGESRGNGRMRLQVETFMREHHMLEPGSRVVAGVSGGADSLCLLDVLCDMRRDWQLEVSAVHVHHGLRGESADRDEAYVRHFCEERQVFCRVYHEQVDRLAREQGKSVEEAGRDIRYFRLEQWRRQWGGDCIAVAHHRDDQAETVLFQLVRGSGLKGAGGIRPVNGRVIRPLLCVGRREIERYLAKREISWCEDETMQRRTIRETVSDSRFFPFWRSALTAARQLIWRRPPWSFGKRKPMRPTRKGGCIPPMWRRPVGGGRYRSSFSTRRLLWDDGYCIALCRKRADLPATCRQII